MAEHNIVVFAGDHCGPEVRLLGGEQLGTETARAATVMLTAMFTLLRSLLKASRYDVHCFLFN